MKFFLCLLAAVVAVVNAGVLSSDRSSGSGSPQTILVRQVSGATQDNLVIEEGPAPEGQAVQTIVLRSGPDGSQQKGQTIRILQNEEGSSGLTRSSQSSSSGQSVQIIGGGHSSEDEQLIKLILQADARS